MQHEQNIKQVYATPEEAIKSLKVVHNSSPTWQDKQEFFVFYRNFTSGKWEWRIEDNSAYSQLASEEAKNFYWALWEAYHNQKSSYMDSVFSLDKEVQAKEQVHTYQTDNFASRREAVDYIAALCGQKTAMNLDIFPLKKIDFKYHLPETSFFLYKYTKTWRVYDFTKNWMSSSFSTRKKAIESLFL